MSEIQADTGTVTGVHYHSESLAGAHRDTGEVNEVDKDTGGAATEVLTDIEEVTKVHNNTREVNEVYRDTDEVIKVDSNTGAVTGVQIDTEEVNRAHSHPNWSGNDVHRDTETEAVTETHRYIVVNTDDYRNTQDIGAIHRNTDTDAEVVKDNPDNAMEDREYWVVH